MSERLSPLPMTTLVTTDLIGVTRGRSFPTDELEDYQAAGCGWVPANSALTPQDSSPPPTRGALMAICG